ncbi:unnamed protein product [Cylindrotheca closterium]|uniref:DUF6824 domain-containing protein n=1 Tax=Cylindrotheca closterium TaxID=2856 RepID=A0AAD2CIX7_9STRA|nr:unnamed protein product [Cylindrotheca closterium]
MMVNKSRFDYLQEVGPSTPTGTRIETEKSSSCIDPLPESFQPGKWDVLCCGGKEGSEHVGNRRYRLCIANNLTAYRNAKSKYHKSMLVSKIVASVKERAENGIGGFVKKDRSTGRWFQVEDKLAREKVSHALRDAIKVQKRKEARQRKISDRLDTRVSPNIRGRLQTDILTGSKLALESRMCSKESPSGLVSSMMFPDKTSQNCLKQGLQPRGTGDDCPFNEILGLVATWDDDWEQSLKECTERFLKSDNEWTYFTS